MALHLDVCGFVSKQGRFLGILIPKNSKKIPKNTENVPKNPKFC